MRPLFVQGHFNLQPFALPADVMLWVTIVAAMLRGGNSDMIQ
jgi:hypothetical protein